MSNGAAHRLDALNAEVAARTGNRVCPSHDAIKADAELFALLPYVGELDDGVDVLEIRNCACTSSIGRVVRASTRPLTDIVKECQMDAQELLARLRAADTAMDAAYTSLREVGGHASDNINLHGCPPATIALGKMIGTHEVASCGSTARDHVYDVVTVSLGDRAAHLYGEDRHPTTAEEAKEANNGSGIPGWGELPL
jgi:hypothetical protein